MRNYEIRTPKGQDIHRFINPFEAICHLWSFRYLIVQLAWREVIQRYKGSFIGLGWSVIQPLLMLCVYTFVFSVIFRSKWGGAAEQSRAAFSMTLFMGLITFNIFAELVNSAPGLILANQSYVKKVVFPLEILPVVRLVSVLINACFSLFVLVIGVVFVYRTFYWTSILLPLVWAPWLFFTLGCSYLLAAIGVFIRDIEASIGVLTTILFFLTPIFYPTSAVPEKFRFITDVNPIAVFVENSRRVMIWGEFPNWAPFWGGTLLSLFVFISGFWIFLKLKKAFADVL
jgi:lipopolysaccharide transport system permease protein